MVKGFKVFILRGNVIDLAVAVVIGAAFTALVIYFVFVVPMKKMLDISSRRKQPIEADPTEVDLLMQIRDLLRDQPAAETAQSHCSRSTDAKVE